MPAKKTARASGRSKKAGQPPREGAGRAQTQRRRRSATTAVKKDTTLMQTDGGTKVLWGANQRKPSRV